MRGAVLLGWLVILGFAAVIGCTVLDARSDDGPAPAATIEGKIAQKEAAFARPTREPLFDRFQSELDTWPSPGAAWPNLFWLGLALIVLATASLALTAVAAARRRRTGLASFPSMYSAVVVLTAGGISALLLPLGLWAMIAAFSEDLGR